MACGNIFFTLVITLSAALITYNVIISANAPLKSGFPGPSNTNPSSIITATTDGDGDGDGGFISVDPVIKMPLDRSKKRLFHTAVTSSDSVYNTWQARVMYYWFKRFKDQPGSEMGGFTRILHSGTPDRFMDEIPTFVAQPLPDGLDQVMLRFFFSFFLWHS